MDTGLEYPEIRQFVKTFDNVEIIRPKKTFKQVISEHGYPFISKEVSFKIYYYMLGSDWALKYKDPEYKKAYSITKWLPITRSDFRISHLCCNITKKAPAKIYEHKNKRVPITAQMAEESRLRTQQWLKNSCNSFDSNRPISNPMSFWTEQDILFYILKYKVPIAEVYGDIEYNIERMTYKGVCKLCTTGCSRTGCIFCGFGAHLEKGESRFERLHRTHPKLYEYCMKGGSYDNEGVWKPDQNGLGMEHIICKLNEIYGDGFIRY